MTTVLGKVYYDATRLFKEPVAVPNIPVALYNVDTGTGAIALTDSSGTYSFLNVPKGNYKVIESWGLQGKISPIDYIASVSTMTIPQEVDPPITVVPKPVEGANQLSSMTPNMYNITVANSDVTNNFYDGPFQDKPMNFLGSSIIGENILKNANNGNMGFYEPATKVGTVANPNPYPGILTGLTYKGSYPPYIAEVCTMNITGNTYDNWWNMADHTTGFETGRQLIVNSSTYRAIFFNETVTVKAKKLYALTMWISNLVNPNTACTSSQTSVAIKVIAPDNSIIYNKVLNKINQVSPPQWIQLGGVFNSGKYTELRIELSTEGDTCGADQYSVDDLELREICLNKLFEIEKKVDSETVSPGDTLTYTAIIKNVTKDSYNQILFKDVLPKTVNFNSGTVKINGSSIGVENANPNKGFTLNTIKAEETLAITFTADVKDLIMDGTRITNNFNITYTFLESQNGDKFTNNIISNDVTTIVTNVKSPISVNKEVDKTEAKVGDIINYTVTINNSGSSLLRNIYFQDNIAPVLQFVKGSITVNGSSTGYEYSNPITGFSLNNILGGKNTIVKFSAKILDIAKGVVSNTAKVTGDMIDSNGCIVPQSIISNIVKTTIINGEQPCINVIKSVDKTTAEVCDILNYTITINNPNKINFTEVFFKDILDQNTEFNVGSIEVNGSSKGHENDNPNTGFTLNDISANSKVIITFSATVLESVNGTIIKNMANVKGKFTIGGVQENNSNITETQVINTHPRINVLKQVDKLKANIGDILTYTIDIENTSRFTFNNVVFKDILEGSAKFNVGSIRVNGSSKGFETADPIIGFDLSDIQSRTTTIVVFTATVQSIENQDIISNTAIVTGIFGKLCPQKIVSNTVQTEILNPLPPEIKVNKDVDKSSASLGDILTYTITINNITKYPFTKIFFKDVLLPVIKFVPGSILVNGSGAGFETADPNIGFKLNDIEAGKSTIVVFKVSVIDACKTKVVKNTARVTGDIVLPSGKSIPQDITSNPAITTLTSQAIIDIIQSVALVETALSHILNAEGEKIQRFLKIPDITPEKLIEVNTNITNTVNAITRLQIILHGKLELVKKQCNSDTE